MNCFVSQIKWSRQCHMAYTLQVPACFTPITLTLILKFMCFVSCGYSSYAPCTTKQSSRPIYVFLWLSLKVYETLKIVLSYATHLQTFSFKNITTQNRLCKCDLHNFVCKYSLKIWELALCYVQFHLY